MLGQFYIREFKHLPSRPHHLDGTFYAVGGRWQNYLYKNGQERGGALDSSLSGMNATRKQIVDSELSAYFETKEEAVANVEKHGHCAVLDWELVEKC